MKKRSFEKWFKTCRKSIANYEYYTNFAKVETNVEDVKINLNILNSLLGTEKDFDKRFVSLIKKYREALSVIPILIAVRDREIPIYTVEEDYCLDFKSPNNEIAYYLRLLHKTGLADVIANKKVATLVDYVFGVEVGLDANSRKNRCGDCMENLVERFLNEAGVSYIKEMSSKRVEKECGVDLSPISSNGAVPKKFDFVVRTKKHIYAIETNFYGKSGSKINETARSYKALALCAQKIPNFSFVWITDGEGWMKSKPNLRDAFETIPHIYNIADLVGGIAKKVFK